MCEQDEGRLQLGCTRGEHAPAHMHTRLLLCCRRQPTTARGSRTGPLSEASHAWWVPQLGGYSAPVPLGRRPIQALPADGGQIGDHGRALGWARGRMDGGLRHIASR